MTQKYLEELLAWRYLRAKDLYGQAPILGRQALRIITTCSWQSTVGRRKCKRTWGYVNRPALAKSI
jgi:hypothetical protein